MYRFASEDVTHRTDPANVLLSVAVSSATMVKTVNAAFHFLAVKMAIAMENHSNATAKKGGEEFYAMNVWLTFLYSHSFLLSFNAFIYSLIIME